MAATDASNHEQRVTDGFLAGAVAQGDTRAALALYDAHAARLYGLAMAMLANATDASAALEEAFAEAWKTIASYDPSRKPIVDWLMEIVHRQSLRIVRSRVTPPKPAPVPAPVQNYELQLNREQPALSRAQSGRMVR